MSDTCKKLVIVVSHPIQHFVPFYRALAQEPSIDLTVVFCSRIGVKPYFDKAMNTTIVWKMDLLGGYDHVFLPEADGITSTHPGSVDNPSVNSELKRLKPDAIMVHGYSHKTSRRALSWARMQGVATLMFGDSNLKNQRSTIKRVIKQPVLRFLFARISAFLAISDENENYYKNYGVSKKKMFRTPFPIDESRYLEARVHRSQLRQKYRELLDISTEAVLVITVGKIVDYKRPQDILDIARLFRETPSSRDVFFLMVGDGPARMQFESISKDEQLPVAWVGFVNVDELPAYYAVSDVLLHACNIESFGLVVPEACCIGLPLVLPEGMGVLGSTGVAQRNRNVLTYPSGNTKKAALQLRDMIESPGKMSDMAKQSRKLYDDNNMQRSVRGVQRALLYVCCAERHKK